MLGDWRGLNLIQASIVEFLGVTMLSRIVLVIVLAHAPLVSAADSPISFSWTDPTGIAAPLLLCGENEPSAALVEKLGKSTTDETRIVIIRSDDRSSTIAFETLPGAIVHCGPVDDEHRAQLIAAVTEYPDRIGICLAGGSAMLIRGRQIKLLEGPAATIMLAAGAGRPLREIKIAKDATHDLTMLHRAAIERTRADFPPQSLPPPRVEHGALFIHGGGEMPPDVVQRFIDLVGGKDSPIVVLPIAAEGDLPEDTSRDTRALTRAGAISVTSLRARARSDVESPEFAAAINSARGVWFNGGRQWRFVDAYLGTKAEELFRDVLRRGGVIGGSSAGASIQSQYMPRGSPLGNTEMMAEGYERGLGFLPGVAVDQHFTQRRRHGDMTRLMRRYPQILGIGLDEGTAIIVRGSTAETIGRGKVHFYDYRTGTPDGQRDYIIAESGQRFDLVDRALLNSP
jgi:cyanophycinase